MKKLLLFLTFVPLSIAHGMQHPASAAGAAQSRIFYQNKTWLALKERITTLEQILAYELNDWQDQQLANLKYMLVQVETEILQDLKNKRRKINEYYQDHQKEIAYFLRYYR